MTRRKVKGHGGCTMTLVVVVLVLAALGRAGRVSHNALSGLEYVNAVTSDSVSSFLLARHTLLNHPPDSSQALLECMWACVAVPGCVTFVMRPSARLCYLSKHSRCSDPTRLLYTVPGSTTYEVKAADATDSNTTCLATCRSSSGCHACGRPNCKGTLCNECSNSCWSVDPLVSGTVTLFVSPASVRSAICKQDWQQVWRDGSVMLFPEHASGTYQMLVVLTYTDKVRQAVFSGVKYTGTYLTVGSYVLGEAGNGWGVPFVNRLSIFTTASNLHRFFYPSGTLSAGGVESYESQMARNATTILRGYYWAHEDPVIASTAITAINLWIKPPGA